MREECGKTRLWVQAAKEERRHHARKASAGGSGSWSLPGSGRLTGGKGDTGGQQSHRLVSTEAVHQNETTFEPLS